MPCNERTTEREREKEREKSQLGNLAQDGRGRGDVQSKAMQLQKAWSGLADDDDAISSLTEH